jgi:citrate lyase gamma subunit
MTDNARIRTIAPDVTAEMIAEQVHLFYDPGTGGGYASFQAREVLYVNGQHQAPMGDFNILQVQLDAIVGQCFGAGLVDPVTGADLSQVSVAGLSVLIKTAYDQLFNARAQADAAAAAAAAAAEQPAG